MPDIAAIARLIGRPHRGADIEIHTFSSLSNIQPQSVVFAKKHHDDTVRLLNQYNNILAIVSPEYEGQLTCPHILSNQPRLDYLRVIRAYFAHENRFQGIHPTAVIEDGAQIAENVTIGANCYIGSEVRIGANTYIWPNVVITGKTTIGTDCCIKSGAIIGQAGFGFEYNEQGEPEAFPHVGEIIIGNRVYIGANTAVDRGTLEATVIHDGAKIDNLVHIAHNDIIGDNALIIAGASLGGGVRVGKNAWIAPNASVKQQLTIGEHSVVGLGAVVIRAVEDRTTVAGNPAKKIEK